MNKKAVRSNSNSAITSLLQAPTEEFVPVFYQEISNIMRGFGDCEHPIKESVLLVERILLQQLRGILQEVVDLAIERRGKPTPKQRDFEHLMRRNPVKVLRLRKYLKDLQFFKKRVRDMLGERCPVYEDLDAAFNQSDEESDVELPEKFDEEKTRRLFRADRISQILATGTQYQEYNEARRTSFLCRNSNIMKARMRAWLGIPNDIVLSPNVLTILAFLSHETIGTLVDYCILSRLNSANRVVEPYDRVTSSGTSYNMMHLCPEVTQGRGQDGVKPITTQEIQEAIRRHTLLGTRKLGMFCTVATNNRPPYLAL